MPFTTIRNDITKLKVDAIVNAANTDLAQGGGVCGAIFKAAGAVKLQSACDALAPIKTGEAVITQGFNLPAKHIIHTSGPVYRGGKNNEEAQLLACYTNSLKLAAEHNLESIAFPLISSGIYGYPKAEALRVATDAIRSFISEHDMDVTLVVFDQEALSVSEELLGSVQSYIDEHYVDEPFSATLMCLIDRTGKKDAEIYRRANIDRRLFSKIRSNAHYAPSKPTVLAFAIALELDLCQTSDLLECAGFALSHSCKFDVIVEYFIQSKKYDVFEINEVLFSYDQPLLGG